MKTQLWIPNSEKQNFNKDLIQYQNAISKSDNICIMMNNHGDICGKSSTVRNHSIPESAVLSNLADSKSGKVLEFRWGIKQWRDIWSRSSDVNPVDLFDTTLFEPDPIGMGDASTGHFACEDHDKLFQDIDVAQHEELSQKKAILNAYRITLYSYDQYRKYTGMVFDKQLKKRILRQNIKSLKLEFCNTNAMINNRTPILRRRLIQIGKTWLDIGQVIQNQSKVMEVTRLEFRSKLRFAASLILNSNNCFAIVCPSSNDMHTINIFYLTKDKDFIPYAISDLTRMAEDTHSCCSYSVEMVKALLSNSFGSLVSSPDSYEGLTQRERNAIQSVIPNKNTTDLLYRMLNEKFRGNMY